MFIIAGTQGSNNLIRRESEKTLCRNCNNMVYKNITIHNDKFTLFFVPLVPYNKRYYRTCPICGISQEVTENEAYNGISGEESEGYLGYKDESVYSNIPGYQNNESSLR